MFCMLNISSSQKERQKGENSQLLQSVSYIFTGLSWCVWGGVQVLVCGTTGCWLLKSVLLSSCSRRWLITADEAAAPQTSSSPISMMTYSSSRLLTAWFMVSIACIALFPLCFSSHLQSLSQTCLHCCSCFSVCFSSSSSTPRCVAVPPSFWTALASFLNLHFCLEPLQRQAM